MERLWLIQEHLPGDISVSIPSQEAGGPKTPAVIFGVGFKAFRN